MILIDATYINVTGGRLLLVEFLNNLRYCEDEIVIILDRRIKEDLSSVSKNWQLIFVHRSLISRTRQLILLNKRCKFQSIFFFNGIPPIVRFNEISTYAYFQNTTIFSSFAKNLYFKLFQKNVDTWIFQTEKTREDFFVRYKSPKTKVLPFFQDIKHKAKPKKIKENKNFFYPTSDHPHKNNNRLIEAFVKLYDKGIKVELEITIKREHYNGRVTPNIKFLGLLRKEEIVKRYERGFIILHPSLKESFGMVLIEACQYRLNIITANLPYVYELIKPTETFDPYKTESIVRTIEKVTKDSILVPGELIITNQIENLINLISKPNV